MNLTKLRAIGFRHCDTCENKPGSPVLCSGCLSNRELIWQLFKWIDDAPKRKRRAKVKACVKVEGVSFNARDIGGGFSVLTKSPRQKRKISHR